jgi:glycosyltransferase involved in cell wall biosynthesis
MKVVLINKSAEKGGASIACKRLMNALTNNGIETTLVVQEELRTPNKQVICTTHNKFKRGLNFFRFVWERLCFLPFESSKEVRFAFSLANTGEDISQMKEVQEADIIHLHWFNQGYLSIDSLKKIFRLGKPVVWTLHDMWAFTGGCHYSGSCLNYRTECGNCYLLRFQGNNDLSNFLNIAKKKLLSKAPEKLTFVGCSNWMAGIAKESSLFRTFNVIDIPNPIDTELYSPHNKTEARKELGLPVEKKILLFGAANILDKRKGLHHLLKALEIFKMKYPEQANEVHCVVFGKAKEKFSVPLASTHVDYISSELQLIRLYSASDVFVLPSLQDNLPNTVVESMSCGIPVIAFNTGGLPEMIDHKINGYLSVLEDDDDLAEGLNFILFKSDYPSIKNEARNKVIRKYSNDIIAKDFIRLYEKLLKP